MAQTDLAELYARSAPRARSLAYLLTGDREVADDLVQDCFVRLAGRLTPVREPDAYLRRMVVNASHSHHRRLRTRRSNARQEALVIGADGDSFSDGAAARAERSRLLDALDALPGRQREAVVLRHWLDLSEAQCAEALGVSVGTVKSLASRGRAALRSLLEDS
ncbi:MAG: SigE family RNA polymerase sigma factor [Frankiales bacterium]|nr:SigE family RNA polymerase sigma factor [Frankiales bacterium]